MPDHFHAVVEGRTDAANLPRFIRLVKQRTGFAFRRTCCGRLWQESYFDRTLRRQESLANVVRYMIHNPVRAGLVEAPVQYPHWGSGVCTRRELLEFLA